MQQQQQQQQQQKTRHSFSMEDDTYYKLKQISSSRGYAHLAGLVSEIFKDYIEARKTELRLE